MKEILRIATRKSRLALWQSNHVAEKLRALYPDLRVELVEITTKGDRILDTALSKIGGRGLFTKEIEDAMFAGKADLAVHSLKDLPTSLPEGLHISAMLPRAEARDVLVSGDGKSNFASLPEGARIGTSSLRRACQLRHSRPDIEIVPIRGNVETRLEKISIENLDGIILAAAGLIRLGLEDRITEYLDNTLCVPAVGQGIIAVESVIDDEDTNTLIAPLHDEATATCAAAERAFLNALEGGCQVPIGAHATLTGRTLQLEGVVVSLDGKECFRGLEESLSEHAGHAGVALAERLRSDGAERVIATLREERNP